MVEHSAGAIVTVSTVEAFRGIPGNSVYSAYNAEVSAFTKSVAVEVGRHGIR
jgi:NAD(P)-dependent dehydrogenase (short-subunit alcohol dehydrogenase family)